MAIHKHKVGKVIGTYLLIFFTAVLLTPIAVGVIIAYEDATGQVECPQP